jgi:hypothetical protein
MFPAADMLLIQPEYHIPLPPLLQESSFSHCFWRKVSSRTTSRGKFSFTPLQEVEFLIIFPSHRHLFDRKVSYNFLSDLFGGKVSSHTSSGGRLPLEDFFMGKFLT